MPNPWEVDTPQKTTDPWERDLTPSTIEQKAGSIPKPSAFLPTKAQIPALVGAGALGLMTGGIGPLAAAGLVGLGAGAGEAYKQIAERNPRVSKFFEEEPPQTSLEAAKNIGIQGAVGAGSELGTGLAGKAIEKLGGGQALENMAESLGQRSLGATKRFLKDQNARTTAKQTAKAMLDEGVIGPRSAGSMAEKATELNQKAGQDIGDFLESKGLGFDPVTAIQKLESLKKPYVGGHYDSINNAIQTAIDTVKAHGNEPISWQEANDLKGVLQGAADWISPKKDAVNEVNKTIATQFKDFLDTQLDSISGGNPQEFSDFIKNKNLYQNTKNALRYLNNRVSSESGNNLLGLTDLISGTGGLSAAAVLHSPETAMYTLAGLGAKKAAERYGTQTAASALRSLADPQGALNLLSRAPIRATLADYLNNRNQQQ